MKSMRFAGGMCAGLLWAAGALAQGTGAGSDANADRKPASDAASQKAGEAKASAQETASGMSDTASRKAGEAKASAQGTGAGMEEKAKATGQQATSWEARTLEKLHAGNQAEIEAGDWMKDHATDSKVKDFASKMVDDHGSMDKDVTDMAQKAGVDLAAAPKATQTEKTHAEHQLASIKKLQGAQADQAYMRMMVQDHTKDVRETQRAQQQAKKTGNTELASLLEKASSKMEDHLKDARKIEGGLTKQASGTSSAASSGTGSSSSKMESSGSKKKDSSGK